MSLIVGAVFAVCAAVLPQRMACAQETFARLIPQDALYFKTNVEFEKVWASVVNSNFWKRVTTLRVWDDTQARAGLEDFPNEFQENVGVALNTVNIMSLLGKETAAAVCVDPGETPKIRGYLLCRSNPKPLAEQLIQKLFDAIKKDAGENVEFKDSVYKGTKISSIKPKEGPLEVEYGFIGDVFAVGIGNTPPRLQTIVDLAGGMGQPLADLPNFKKTVESSKMTAGRYTGSFYLDLQKIGQILAAIDLSSLPMPAQAMFGGMKQSFSVPMVIGGTGYVDRGLAMRLITLPAGEVLDKLVQLSFAAGPAPGSTIGYVPESALAYVAANNVPDWEVMWPLLLEQWERQGVTQQMNMVFQQIETFLGIKIGEDVIPWLGNEFAVLFADIDTKPGFPYPKFALMLKIKDKGKATAFLEKLTSVLKEFSEETGFKFEKSLYNNYGLSSLAVTIPVPLPMMLTPSYGVVDDFLIVASSTDLIKQMIDTSKGQGKDLASNPGFKAVNFPAKTNSIGFCNWGKGMEVAKAVAAWVVESSKEQPNADAIKAAVENHVLPIANCLSALDSLSVYQINEGNISAATYIIRVKDLPGS
jgi:hypothetical protein